MELNSISSPKKKTLSDTTHSENMMQNICSVKKYNETQFSNNKIYETLLCQIKLREKYVETRLS